MRVFYLIAGCVALVMAIIGALLPLMPTTIFLIISAFCFARSSEKLHQWLLEHPVFGPILSNWEEHRAISRKSKMTAGIAMILTVIISFAFGVAPIIIGIQAIILSAVFAFIVTRPEI